MGLAGFGGRAGLLAARREATAAADMKFRLPLAPLVGAPVEVFAAVEAAVVLLSLTLLPLTDEVPTEDTSFPP